MKAIIENRKISKGKNYLLLKNNRGDTLTSYRKKLNNLIKGGIGEEVLIVECEEGYEIDGELMSGTYEGLADFISRANL